MTLDRTTSQSYIICTSSTRPVSPVTGAIIFEQDTSLQYYYDGSVWRLNGPQTIAYQSLGAAASSITLSIPEITNGLHLFVQAALLNDTGAYGYVQPNGDNTTANYYEQGMYGQNSSTVAFTGSNVPGGRIGYADNSSTYYSGGAAWILNFAGSGNKTIQNWFGAPVSLTTSAFDMVTHTVWKSTATVNSLVIRAGAGNFRAGSNVSVQVIGSS